MKKLMKWFGIVGILLLAFAACKDSGGEKQKTPDQQAARQTTETNDVSVTPKKGLGMTPTQFMDAFNAFAQSVKLDMLSIPAITLSTGEVNNTFTHEFAKNLVITGTVRKSDNKILSLVMVASPKTHDETTALFFIYGIIMGTINPELSKEERGSLVIEMFNKVSPDHDAHYEAVRGPVQYNFSASKVVGVWLVVKNVND